MHRIIIKIILLGLVLVPLGGCTMLHYATGPQKPVLANRGLQRPHHITSAFVEKGHRIYLFWGLLPIAGEDGEDLIARPMALGDGIVNLTARERYSFIDNLIGLLTVGIVSGRTLSVQGDVFAYEPPPGVIVPPGTVVAPPAAAWWYRHPRGPS